MSLSNGAGRHLADLPLGGPDPDGTVTTTMRRADLYAALRTEAERRGIPVTYGRRLVGARHSGAGVVAEFADGTSAHGAVLVGADGLRSRTREVLNPNGPRPRYLGLLNAGGFSAPGVVDVPPGDERPGVVHMAFGRRCFFGWSVAPDGTVWWFANPPRKRPPEPGDWTPASWRAHLLDLVAGDRTPAAAIIEATDEILGPWGTFDLPRVGVWHDGRIVLLGDAAHAASPSSGQGASMAIEDAVVLARSLRDEPDPLAAYERVRRPRVEKVVAYGRRSSSSKVAGPIGAAIRDTMTPLVLKMLYRKGDPQAWILDHRL
jgi:FAD-dependent urate hydroxylase